MSEVQEASQAQFRAGLIALLKPVVETTDQRIQAVFKSQEALAAQIDVLTTELVTFMEVAKLPALNNHVQILLDSRQRLQELSKKLTDINERLDRLMSVAEALSTAS